MTTKADLLTWAHNLKIPDITGQESVPVLKDLIRKATVTAGEVIRNQAVSRPSSCSPRSIFIIATSVAVAIITALFARTLGCDQALQICETDTTKLRTLYDDLDRKNTECQSISKECVDDLAKCESAINEPTDRP